MLKACLFLALQAAAITGLALCTSPIGSLTAANPTALDSPDRWTITYPTDGTIAYGPVSHVGQGPTNESGHLFMYYYSNTISGGVYGSELSLERTAAVDTFNSSVWAEDPFGDIGEFYSAVLGDDVLQGDNDPLDSSDPEQDVDSLVMGMGGDGAAYFITEEM